MEVKLSDDQLNQAMQTAVINALGDIGRAQVVKEVVTHLMTPGVYGRKTPLQDIINRVGEGIAGTLLREQLSADTDFAAKVREVYLEAFQQAFTGEKREKLVERLACKMSEALTSDK